MYENRGVEVRPTNECVQEIADAERGEWSERMTMRMRLYQLEGELATAHENEQEGEVQGIQERLETAMEAVTNSGWNSMLTAQAEEHLLRHLDAISARCEEEEAFVIPKQVMQYRAKLAEDAGHALAELANAFQARGVMPPGEEERKAEQQEWRTADLLIHEMSYIDAYAVQALEHWLWKGQRAKWHTEAPVVLGFLDKDRPAGVNWADEMEDDDKRDVDEVCPRNKERQLWMYKKIAYAREQRRQAFEDYREGFGSGQEQAIIADAPPRDPERVEEPADVRSTTERLDAVRAALYRPEDEAWMSTITESTIVSVCDPRNGPGTYCDDADELEDGEIYLFKVQMLRGSLVGGSDAQRRAGHMRKRLQKKLAARGMKAVGISAVSADAPLQQSSEVVVPRGNAPDPVLLRTERPADHDAVADPTHIVNGKPVAMSWLDPDATFNFTVPSAQEAQAMVLALTSAPLCLYVGSSELDSPLWCIITVELQRESTEWGEGKDMHLYESLFPVSVYPMAVPDDRVVHVVRAALGIETTMRSVVERFVERRVKGDVPFCEVELVAVVCGESL
eukprot:CAMPEP_0181347448 /NCGR_PEP_ID=MMETSP1101-20121128/33885_1 /TAXON_ID=46948 /ORGANISM="Rhodomonas abbreviata, Strain Caron Lab Isolate" /LENGTH=564 /DNA_ID=CAMNT_0023459665 /DNA_START=35 /DNA_END=1726 /DNA_ORIENTATION=+